MGSGYFSFFSGIGGLESTSPAVGYCEINSNSREILSQRFPRSKIEHDIRNIKSVNAEILAGGWPCQDISIAGLGKGLKGENSKLFYELLRIAKASNAKTIVAENVSNILRLDNGLIFKEVIREFYNAGYTTISWRLLNAREFGLPHHRNRVFFVASKDSSVPLSIFREINSSFRNKNKVKSAGFYWTAGTHSINYSKGYVPTIKVGSSISIPSPPAVHYGDTVRMISPLEALKLQGFSDIDISNFNKGMIYGAAGNAVALPVGNYVMDGVLFEIIPNDLKVHSQLSLFEGDFLDSLGKIPNSGLYNGEVSEIELRNQKLAINLDQYLDFKSNDQLSARAASGLLRRLNESDGDCPSNLKHILNDLASNEES